jgi:hypothetical protein
VSTAFSGVLQRSPDDIYIASLFTPEIVEGSVQAALVCVLRSSGCVFRPIYALQQAVFPPQLKAIFWRHEAFYLDAPYSQAFITADYVGQILGVVGAAGALGLGVFKALSGGEAPEKVNRRWAWRLLAQGTSSSAVCPTPRNADLSRNHISCGDWPLVSSMDTDYPPP